MAFVEVKKGAPCDPAYVCVGRAARDSIVFSLVGVGRVANDGAFVLCGARSRKRWGSK